MLRKLALSLFFAFCATITFNKAKAAFPTEKKLEAKSTVSANKISTDASTQAFSKKETGKESNALLKKSVNSSGGKSKIAAALLAIFLGSFGVHSFYMGQTQKGLLQLGLTLAGLTLFIAGVAGSANAIAYGGSISGIAIVGYLIVVGVGIWALVDFIRILTGSLAPEEGFDD